MEGCVGRELAASLEDCGALMQQTGVERWSTWGAYEWVTEVLQFDDHIEALWIDIMELAYVGVHVKWHDNQVCVVQLASVRHVVLLDALSLPSTVMQMHLRALFEDEGVVKVCHGHINNLACVLDIEWISQIFDIAEHAQALHGLSPDGQPPLRRCVFST